MNSKGAVVVAQDTFQNQAEGAATRILIPAIMSALCGAFVNQVRKRMAAREQEKHLASNVAEIRQIMNPPDPDKDDLRTIVEQTRAGLRVQEAITASLAASQQALTERFDENLSEQQKRHAELCALIVGSRR